MAHLALVTISAFHKQLFWPSSIYSASVVISAIEQQLNMSFVTPTLKEALTDFYVIDKQYKKAFAIYADLRKPGIFEFIEEHNLHDALQDKALPLMTLDPKRAVALLVQQREFIKPSEVVSQLRKAENNSTYRYLLHEYLHALFEKVLMQGKTFMASRWSFMQNMNPDCFSLSYAATNITLLTRHMRFVPEEVLLKKKFSFLEGWGIQEKLWHLS